MWRYKEGNTLIYAEKRVLLRDGSEALLRSPRVEDAPVLLDYLKVTASETEFLMRYPEEVSMTLEAEEQYIRKQLDSPNDCMIVCEVNGRLAGNCSLGMNSRRKTRHRGTIGIALISEFWGRGIGTVLMGELIALGEQRGLMQLELQVFQGNERAIALYRKMGFETVCSLPNAIRLKDGSLRDEYTMVRKL